LFVKNITMKFFLRRILFVLLLVGLGIGLIKGPTQVYASGTLDDACTNTYNGDYWLLATSSRQVIAQKFVPSVTGNLDHITVYLAIQGTPPGNVFLKVYSDNSGQPGTLLYTSNTVAQSTLNSSTYTSSDFSFSSGDTVNSGTTYWLGVTNNHGVDASNYNYMQATSTACHSPAQTWNGSAWSSYDSVSSVRFQEYYNPLPTNTPTPTPTPTVGPQIVVSPSSSSVAVGQSLTVSVQANGGGTAFNAAQATVTVSSNLAITGLTTPTSSGCNFTYTQAPTVNNPSFAGAIFGSSKTNCTVYKLTLQASSTGTGTVTITNPLLKAYTNGADLNPSATNGSYTLTDAWTPTPTQVQLSNLSVSSAAETYNSTSVLSGTKDTSITSVYVNDSTSGVSYPTNTTWQKTVNLSSGANSFNVYGKDGSNNQTATIIAPINLHTPGDINGDGVIDIIDFSLFASDWGKTSNLTNLLSDMNGDSAVNLTDYSILAKVEAQ
jgi:hypothetical protein